MSASVSGNHFHPGKPRSHWLSWLVTKRKLMAADPRVEQQTSHSVVGGAMRETEVSTGGKDNLSGVTKVSNLSEVGPRPPEEDVDGVAFLAETYISQDYLDRHWNIPWGRGDRFCAGPESNL